MFDLLIRLLLEKNSIIIFPGMIRDFVVCSKGIEDQSNNFPFMGDSRRQLHNSYLNGLTSWIQRKRTQFYKLHFSIKSQHGLKLPFHFFVMSAHRLAPFGWFISLNHYSALKTRNLCNRRVEQRIAGLYEINASSCMYSMVKWNTPRPDELVLKHFTIIREGELSKSIRVS
jgi:hypothetical protein